MTFSRFSDVSIRFIGIICRHYHKDWCRYLVYFFKGIKGYDLDPNSLYKKVRDLELKHGSQKYESGTLEISNYEKKFDLQVV
jgi:hypothetical protein